MKTRKYVLILVAMAILCSGCTHIKRSGKKAHEMLVKADKWFQKHAW